MTTRGKPTRSLKTFLLTSVSNTPEATAEAVLQSLLDRGWYVFAAPTAGLKRLRAEDRLCFYRPGAGVVAEAEVASAPEGTSPEIPLDAGRFPWAVRVKNVRYFFDKPVAIDATLRSRLDAFRGKDSAAPWAWFVQSARLVSAHDFEVLVGRA